MRDSFLKRLEILLRRFLIFIIGFFVSRRNPLPAVFDFNASKILFIRQDRIGDVLVSTPIFTSLKSHYPSAIVDVLLSANNHFVLVNDPIIRKRWIYQKRLGKIIALVRLLRKEQYDFAVDLMDNPSVTSTFLSLLSGARWNIGIAKDNNYVYDIRVPMLSRRETHIVDRIAQLLIPFHIDPKTEPLALRYFTSPESNDFADHFLASLQAKKSPLLGINISAGGPARFWGIDNYRDLLSMVHEIYSGLLPILLFHPSDKEKAAKIVEGNPHVILSPITNTFDQFAALIKKVSILISPDTSAIHLASAFHIPSVVLYVQSDKALRIWEPYGTDYEVVVTDVDDLSTIPFRDVQAALEKLINRCQSNISSSLPHGEKRLNG
jgi:ADP-heptose:LPS heptosyltransferase